VEKKQHIYVKLRVSVHSIHKIACHRFANTRVSPPLHSYQEAERELYVVVAKAAWENI
jgi:hypothetical protein